MSTPNRFRFRAWDTSQKKMRTDFTLDARGGINQNHAGAHEALFKVMQSTGLSDRNGVEIFEGDIIKFKDKKFGGSGDIIQGQVLWQETFNSLRVYTPKADSFYRSIMSCCDKAVVGNIYENPELLQ